MPKATMRANAQDLPDDTREKDFKRGVIALMGQCLRETAERLKTELAAGVNAEREEEIRIWFAYHKKWLAAAAARATEDQTPIDLRRPRFLN